MTANCKVIVAIWIILTVGTSALASDKEGTTTEYYVKAAFLCQLTRFVEWPKQKAAEPNHPIVIGIVGKNPFADAFQIARSQAPYNIQVMEYPLMDSPSTQDPNQQQAWSEYTNQLRACHIVYLAGDLKNDVSPLLTALRPGCVLTIAESEGFLEKGGIMNLLLPNPKIRFEVSLVAARQSRIRIPAQVLRLAKRVIEK